MAELACFSASDISCSDKSLSALLGAACLGALAFFAFFAGFSALKSSTLIPTALATSSGECLPQAKHFIQPLSRLIPALGSLSSCKPIGQEKFLLQPSLPKPCAFNRLIKASIRLLGVS